ncbi:hypothetical protein [Allgaiera indica]|nr:hypothetical protein [Allgaiera indica]
MTRRTDCGMGNGAGAQERRLTRGMGTWGAPLAALSIAGAVAVAMPARADGTFFQLDRSRTATGGVLAVQRGRVQFALSRSDWNGGFHWVGRVSWRFPIQFGSVPVTLSLGPAVQYSHPSAWRGGLSVAAESYNPTSWGSLYLLSDLSTIDAGYFFLAQFNHKSGVSLELAAVGNNAHYADRTVTLDYRFPNTPYSLRLGRKLQARETYIGFSINTF